jgi:hypothetical protein
MGNKMTAREAGDRHHCRVSIANCFVNDQIDNRQLAMIAVARFAARDFFQSRP